jgi:hypothetical protein
VFEHGEGLVDGGPMEKRIAWVGGELGRRREEERVAEIVGRRILGGRYFEVAYPSGEPGWRGEDFHALDFGLELDLEDKVTWSFIWQQAGLDEALLAYRGQLLGDQLISDGDFAVWPINEIRAWQDVLGATVVSTASAWERFHADLCPVTWVLQLDSGRAICLTLGTRTQTGGFTPSHDDVAVFFDLQTARRHGVPTPN